MVLIFPGLWIYFPGQICFVSSWALQSLRACRAEQWKICQSSPTLVFILLCFFICSHIHEPVLQILAGSTLESWIVFALFSGKYSRKMGKDGAVLRLVGQQSWLGCTVGKPIREWGSIHRVSVSLSSLQLLFSAWLHSLPSYCPSGNCPLITTITVCTHFIKLISLRTDFLHWSAQLEAHFFSSA